MIKKMLLIIISITMTALAFSLTACYRHSSSEPMPEETMVFVRNWSSFSNTATAIIIDDGVAYVGELTGGVRDDGVPYAKLGNHFSRLTLEFNGSFYRVTNMNTLWSSAVMHDAYPQGLIFNKDRSISWIHVMSSDDFRGPYIRYNGIRWPVTRLAKLNNTDVYKWDNTPDILPDDYYVNRNGRNSTTAFSFIGTYLYVAMGEQVAPPTNLKFVIPKQWNNRTIEWNAVPNATSYIVYFNNIRQWTNHTWYIPVSSLQNPFVPGTYTVEIVAQRRREIINGVITHFPSSESAIMQITLYANGTISYVYPVHNIFHF